MADLDVLLRGAAAGIALLLGAMFWRARPSFMSRWIGPACAVGIVGYLLWSHSVSLSWPPYVRLGVAIVALSPPFFFWALARMIFDDGFVLRPVHWLWLLLIESAGIGQFVLRDTAPRWLLGLLGLGFRMVSIAVVAHALWIVWRGRPADLVEFRARLRVGLVISAGVCTALILVAALLYEPSARWPPRVELGAAFLLLCMCMATGMLVLGVDRELLPAAAPHLPFVPEVAVSGDSTDQPSAEEIANDDADDAAGNVLRRLAVLMKDKEVWRETGQTIGGLAAQVGVPEYRLRRLINQQLGFRNFTAFLNEHRLAAAAERLADPGQARTPILTIALELGWGSIGPFNRAFRTRYGMTPSDYRQERTP